MRHCSRGLKAGSAAGALGTLLLLVAASAPAAGPASRATLERGRRDLPLVALTFDGGSDAGFSERILAILEEKEVRATFFLAGEYIARYPELALRIAGGGHEVGNHTWSHPHLTAWAQSRRQTTLPGVDRDLLLRELDRTAQAWEELTGLSMAPLWRAPFGETNGELLGWAAEAGWGHVGWSRDERGRRSLDSLDWVDDRASRLYLSSRRILERLLSFDEAGDRLNGGIVLMHLCTRRDDPGVDRLPELIDALRGRGYRLVTVGELLAASRLPAPTALARTTAR